MDSSNTIAQLEEQIRHLKEKNRELKEKWQQLQQENDPSNPCETCQWKKDLDNGALQHCAQCLDESLYTPK